MSDDLTIDLVFHDWAEEGIPFGKYASVPLCDVPTGYLAWFLENVEGKQTGLVEAVETELWTRSDRP